MKPREAVFARFVKSRYMATILACMALVAILVAARYGRAWMLTANRGLAFPSPNLWLASLPPLSTLASITALLATAGLMLSMNVRYGILRSYSTTFAGLFLLMAASLPPVAVWFQGSAWLALLMMGAAWLMCGAYHDPSSTRPVFMAFLLVSTGAMTQYGFIVYLPVLLLGCAQMRALNLRTLLAALLGTLTPWWLWWAFGHGLDFRLHRPEMADILLTLSHGALVRLLVTGGVTLLLSFICAGVNIFRIFSLNARTRSYNGLLLVMSGVTWVMLFVDFTNIPFYLVLLDALTAFQIGHFFALNYQRRGYLIILIVALTYLGFYIWNMAA